MIAMAGLGLVMTRLGWPRVPLMIGLVLGTLAETRFFLSMDAYGTAWLLRPGVVVMGLVLLASLVVPARRARRAPAVGGPQTGPQDTSWMHLAFLAGLVTVFALTWTQTSALPERAAVFPRLVVGAAGLLALTELARTLRQRQRGLADVAAPPDPEPTSGPVVAWVGLFVVGAGLLGFVVGLPLAIFVYLRTTARQTLGRALVLAGAAALFLELFMGRVLRLPLPVGWLYEGLAR